MSDVSGTVDLIARLKAATGPSRALDSAIAAHLGVGGWTAGEWAAVAADSAMVEPSIPEAALYTSSFDAALSLVPEGHDWIVASVNGHYGGTPYACVGSREEHFGETPILSLCIAALLVQQTNSAAADEGAFP